MGDIREAAMRSIISMIGEDVTREGLHETPARVVRSWGELYKGYAQSPSDVLKVFDEDDGTVSSEMVILRRIEFYSMCEHHMLPFFGEATIAYIPHKTVVGISKLARLLDVYARRLQIQERICKQVTSALMKHVGPRGAACVLRAQHLCMMARGVGKQNSEMVTSSLEGVFKTDAKCRAEFMALV